MAVSCAGDNMPARTSARVNTDGALTAGELSVAGKVFIPGDGSDGSERAFVVPGAAGCGIV
jgi:hypothetical protein